MRLQLSREQTKQGRSWRRRYENNTLDDEKLERARVSDVETEGRSRARHSAEGSEKYPKRSHKQPRRSEEGLIVRFDVRVPLKG